MCGPKHESGAHQFGRPLVAQSFWGQTLGPEWDRGTDEITCLHEMSLFFGTQGGVLLDADELFAQEGLPSALVDGRRVRGGLFARDSVLVFGHCACSVCSAAALRVSTPERLAVLPRGDQINMDPKL
jgi:hypothetical protein